MTKQKIKILTIILGALILIISTSFALVAKANVGYIDASKTPTANIGTNNRVKICRDVACENPGIINFEISDNSPLIIDTEKGLSGKVWGGDLGWITFNPPYGGVFFADPAIGLLKGTAWSETSGAINFSVTGQKIVIDPKTGEWNGWAWASGPYGGWVKFDCADASCVHTIWSNQISKDIQPSQKISFLKNIFNQIIDFKYQLLSTIGQKFSNTYNSVAVFLANVFTQNSLVNKNEPAISPTSPTPSLREKVKTVVQEKSKIMSDNFDTVITSSADLFEKMTTVKYQIFEKAGDSYYSFSYNLVNLRSSVLEALNNLIK